MKEERNKIHYWSRP